jgi:ParB family transcriptional regulator, chromosome partitioning protein
MSSNRADDAPRKEVKMYDPDVVVIIGYDTKDGPSHPQFDAESNAAPVVEADVLFTYEHGIIQPISGKRDGKRVLVVAGRGRTRQLREANKRRIKDGLKPWFLPVQIVLGDAAKMLAIKHGENSHRRELNPLARARDAYDLLQQMPEGKAAVVMGLGLNQFRNTLKLLSLAPAVAKVVMTGGLSATAATEMSELSEEEQTAKLAELLEGAVSNGGAKPTVRDVKAKVREANGKTPLLSPAQRVSRALEQITKLDDAATKDELWSAIRKVRSLLAPPAAGKSSAKKN